MSITIGVKYIFIGFVPISLAFYTISINMEKKDDDITSLELKVASSIQSERLARKMSQLELALEAGISQGYLAMVESHQKIPTITTVFKIAKALNINPASLLSDADIDRHEIKKQVIELIRQKL